VGTPSEPVLRLANGRLTLHASIGVGGMASVYVGQLRSEEGIRTVAVKRPHPHLVSNPSFIAVLVDEARLALRIKHPNVVEALEVILDASELLLVMEYVEGESLVTLLGLPGVRDVGMPAPVAAAIVVGAAEGLHAAHEAPGDKGPLELVHRDVSPHNLILGVDGRARVLDFGVARAAGRLQSTREGQLKGKLRYMAPELLEGLAFDRRVDVFGLGAVFWECLTGRSLVDGESDGAVIRQLIAGEFDPPSKHVPATPEADGVVARALSLSPADRYPTAAAFADAVREVITPASPEEMAAWLGSVAAESLAARARLVVDAQATHDRMSASPSSEHGLVASTTVPGVAVPEMRRRTTLVAAAAAAALLLVLGVSAVVLRVRGASGPDAVAPGAQSPLFVADPSPEGGASAEPAPPSSAVASASAPTSPAPSASGDLTSGPKAAARGGGGGGGKRAVTPPRAKPSCDPPYTIDERGIKHFKPHCLQRP